MAAGAAVAIAFFWVALFFLSRLNPCGAFWVFGFPTLAGSFLLSENPDPPSFFQLVLMKLMESLQCLATGHNTSSSTRPSRAVTTTSPTT